MFNIDQAREWADRIRNASDNGHPNDITTGHHTPQGEHTMQNNTTTTKQVMEAEFQATLTGAVEACLWSTMPTPADEDIELLEPADQYTITEQEVNKLRGTLAHHMAGWFVENYFTICPVISMAYTWEHVGHDFWLTSQGHGAGFWDRGLDEVGDTLTDSVDGYTDIVGLYLNDEATHVHIDPYNVLDFSTSLFHNND